MLRTHLRSAHARALNAARNGEPMPLDVAAQFIDAGIDVEKLEAHLERLVAQEAC